jgi:hypothetical protein
MEQAPTNLTCDDASGKTKIVFFLLLKKKKFAFVHFGIDHKFILSERESI